jgi:Uma2 family endonuclease
MSSLPKIRLTSADYLEMDRQSQLRHQFLGGEIFTMTGASRRHNLISVNLATLLNTQLRDRDCEVYASDMRVKVSPQGDYTYPDLVVVCGSPSFEDSFNDTLLNPVLIVEILSKSTEAYDRGLKFELYRGLETLREFVLIAQDRCHLEHYHRQVDDRWLLTEISELKGCLHLESIDVELVLEQIYFKVSLDETDPS